MGTVIVNNLRVNAIIGTLDHERINRQELIFDVEFDYDSVRAAGSDDFRDAVDYSAVERCVAEEAEKSSFQLLEALVSHIAGEIMKNFAVSRVKISVGKPAASAYGAMITFTEEFFSGGEA